MEYRSYLCSYKLKKQNINTNNEFKTNMNRKLDYIVIAILLLSIAPAIALEEFSSPEGKVVKIESQEELTRIIEGINLTENAMVFLIIPVSSGQSRECAGVIEESSNSSKNFDCVNNLLTYAVCTTCKQNNSLKDASGKVCCCCRKKSNDDLSGTYCDKTCPSWNCGEYDYATNCCVSTVDTGCYYGN
jgi:hypothetical protein